MFDKSSILACSPLQQEVVSHGPHLMGLDGLGDLDDLEVIALYEAVLLAEAARSGSLSKSSFLPSFPSTAAVAAAKNKQDCPALPNLLLRRISRRQN
jgi:hypothetical protein